MKLYFLQNISMYYARLTIIFTMIQRLFCTETILKDEYIHMIIACTHKIAFDCVEI